MNFGEALRFSIDALQANRLRTFLTALGLIIGNASVILVVTISLAGKDLILEQIRGIGSNLVYASYQTGGQDTARVQGDFVHMNDVEAIRQELGSEVAAVAPVTPYNDRISLNGKVREIAVIGVDENYQRVRNIVVLSGRAFDDSDIKLRERVIMLTEKLAQHLYGTPQGAVGRVLRISNLQFRIIGVFGEKTSTFGQSEITDETVLMPITVVRYFVQYDRVDPVYIQVRNASDVPHVTSEVRAMLESRHRPGARYDVSNLKPILDTANKIADVLTVVLLVVSALALMISGIGIMNIMLVTVTERTREIGLRMAVGASRHEILGQFLTEAVVISLIGGAIGILIGVAIPVGVQFFTSAVEVSVSPLSILVAFLVSFTVGVGFGLLPARRASLLNPTEALRYE